MIARCAETGNLVAAVVIMSEIEQFEQIADCGAIDRHIGIPTFRFGIGEIVAAALCDRVEVPVALDELEN